jgi:hypothetical protein
MAKYWSVATLVVFLVCPAFATFIDPVPDANGKMSKLLITSAERKELIAEIDYHSGSWWA